MSVKTYKLRDIVMLMNEAIDAFKKSEDAYTKMIESAKSWNDMMSAMSTVNAHHTRGMVRLTVAYDALVKGAKLEEEKERKKET